jgi:acyl dehydratase
MGRMEKGDSMDELAVTPDRYLPNRYAGASGDFNPIHIDPEFARQVGLPGAILHGLYVMGLVSRAVTDAAGGDPRSLEGLSVQFRGMSFPEQEIAITGQVISVEGDVAEIDVIATQGGNQVIRNAVAKVSHPT